MPPRCSRRWPCPASALVGSRGCPDLAGAATGSSGREADHFVEVEQGTVGVSLALARRSPGRDTRATSLGLSRTAFGVVGDGQVELAAGAAGVGALGVGRRELRVQLEGLVEVGDGAVGVVLVLETNHAPSVKREGMLGIEPDGFVVVGQGDAGLLHFLVDEPPHGVGPGGVGVLPELVGVVVQGLVEGDHVGRLGPAREAVGGEPDPFFKGPLDREDVVPLVGVDVPAVVEPEHRPAPRDDPGADEGVALSQNGVPRSPGPGTRPAAPHGRSRRAVSSNMTSLSFLGRPSAAPREVGTPARP